MIIYLTCCNCGEEFTECRDLRPGESVEISIEDFKEALCDECLRILNLKILDSKAAELNGALTDESNTYTGDDTWLLEPSEQDIEEENEETEISDDDWMSFFGYDGMNY